jgi:hypothetical protein
MGKNKLPNELLGDIYRRVNGIVNKIEDGGLDYQLVINNLQALFEEKIGKKWRVEDDIIYFSVTSDGTTGEDWVNRLEGKGFRVGDYAEQVLRSLDFKPTSGVTTEVAVIKGILFQDNDRITKKIRAEASRRNFTKPNAELACLVREKFTDNDIKAMGLWLILSMHEPLSDAYGDPRLLNVNRDNDRGWLDAFCGRPNKKWLRGFGFAFAVSSQ